MNDNVVVDISRRRLFQLLGIGAAGAAGVGLAGCSKAEPEEGEAAFHGAYPYKKPPTGHFNRGGGPIGYAPVVDYILEGPYSDVMHMVGGYWKWDAREWVYYLASGSRFSDDQSTFTVTLRDGLKWSDGERLTAQDYLTTMYVQWIQNSPAWASIEGIEAPDDTTFVVRLNQPASVIDRYILRSAVIDTGTYGEWADRAKALIDAGEATDGDEAGKLNKEFQQFRPEKLIASGPFVLDPDSITDSKMMLVKNPDGYLADKVGFERIVLYNGETPQVAPLVENKTIDYATHGFNPAQERSFTRKGYKILRPPNYSGPAIFIQQDKLPEFRDKRARQALAHAIERDENGKVALGDSGVGVELMAGFSDVQVPDWISEEDQARFNRYPYDPARAAELLEEAGWSRRGDDWYTSEGKRAKYTIRYPSEFADWSAAGDNAAEQLRAFGIDVTPQGVKFEQYNAEVDKGNFELGIQAWGASQHPHPHFSFSADLFIHNIPIAKNAGGRGMGFELQVETDTYGRLDLEDVVNDSGRGLDEAEQKANITKAALAFNELLPIVPLFERYGNNACLEGERVRRFPAEDDPIVKNSAYADNFVVMGMLDGTIRPA